MQYMMAYFCLGAFSTYVYYFFCTFFMQIMVKVNVKCSLLNLGYRTCTIWYLKQFSFTEQNRHANMCGNNRAESCRFSIANVLDVLWKIQYTSSYQIPLQRNPLQPANGCQAANLSSYLMSFIIILEDDPRP